MTRPQRTALIGAVLLAGGGVALATGVLPVGTAATLGIRVWPILLFVVAITVVVVNALVTFAVLRAGYGLLVLVASTTATNLLGYLGYAATARMVCPSLRLSPRWFSAARWERVGRTF